MSTIVTTTRPTDEGEMLWCVQYTSSFYDSDCRGPGDVSVKAVAYVLARGMKEALDKTVNLPAFTKARQDRDKGAPESYDAQIVTIETLVPAVEDRNKRTRSMYAQHIDAVFLSCPEDAARYRLAVCLVPIEDPL